VVDDVSFTVPTGEMLSILGPSGCGKSTTLRLLAGLERPEAGEIHIGGKLASSAAAGVAIRPEDRDVGFVFQSYALWPHLTVAEHVAYPLQSHAGRRASIRERVATTLEAVDLDGLGERYPSELSGGQQQRVALARALVQEPSVLLLDEPLSNLDAGLRSRMALELRRLQRSLGFTAVYVTHDRVEALSLSDSMLVMESGRAIEYGPPREVYERPRSAFAARFVSAANVFGAVVTERKGDRLICEVTGGERLATIVPASLEAPQERATVSLAVRPESFSLAPSHEGAAAGSLHGDVESITYYGSYTDVVVKTPAGPIRARVRPESAEGTGIGARVTIEVLPDAVVVLREDSPA
jgi:ABC-type Fe3+/spermidine/putrescine transport system ATPase subunit